MTTTTSSSAPPPVDVHPGVPAARPDPGLRAAVAAEWSKLRTARAPRRNLVLGTVLGIAMSLLLSLVVGATYADWPASEQAAFDPVLYPLSGSLIMAIFYVAASVGAVAPEFGTGMIRLTLTATPKRGRVLAAKVIVVTVAVTVASAVALVAMVLGSQAIFAANDLPTAGLGDADLQRTLVFLVLTGPVFPALSVAIAFLLRTAAASISTVLALIFLPSILGGLLPEWWQRNILSILPGPASDSIAVAHLDRTPMHLHPVAALVVLVVWIGGSLLLARRTLDHRDA